MMPKFTIDEVMPEVGNIKRGREIGRDRTSRERSKKFVYARCPSCGFERWLQLRTQPITQICRGCSGKASAPGRTGSLCSTWKGGRITTTDGYIAIYLQPDDFFYSMTSRGYVLEHRLVVAKALGRCLHRWEIVHHKHDKYPAGSKEDKQDNRYPENLQLVMEGQHKQITILENKIRHLEGRVTLIEAENILLKAEVKI